MITCKELRSRARASLDGNIFGTTWLYALLAILLFSVASSISSAIVVGPLLIVGPLSVGVCKLFLGASRKDAGKNNLAVLIDGFTSNFVNNLLTGILVFLYTFLWSLLFIIPGIVKTYSYSMTYYILNDHPEYTPTEAITASRQMMDGYKWKAFLLDLSFIGWYFVGALVCGIGTLWVNPYHQAAKTELYEEIKRVKGL